MLTKKLVMEFVNIKIKCAFMIIENIFAQLRINSMFL